MPLPVGLLHVIIDRAAKLPKMDAFSQTDAYVEVEVEEAIPLAELLADGAPPKRWHRQVDGTGADPHLFGSAGAAGHNLGAVKATPVARDTAEPFWGQKFEFEVFSRQVRTAGNTPRSAARERPLDAPPPLGSAACQGSAKASL